jgi:hypothetical protein
MTLPGFLRPLLRRSTREGVAVQPERGRVLLRASRFPEELAPAEARALARGLEDAANEAEREERWT